MCRAPDRLAPAGVVCVSLEEPFPSKWSELSFLGVHAGRAKSDGGQTGTTDPNPAHDVRARRGEIRDGGRDSKAGTLGRYRLTHTQFGSLTRVRLSCDASSGARGSIGLNEPLEHD